LQKINRQAVRQWPDLWRFRVTARPGVLTMGGMGSPASLGRGRPEQLIGALIPPATWRPGPAAPLVAPMLPRMRLPVDAVPEALLLDMASLDASGRFSARRLLRELGWLPGHRVDAVVVGDAVVFGGSATGRQSVGGRGELAVPASARSLTGLEYDNKVVLVAAMSQDVLVVHSRRAVARLLAEHYGRQAGKR